MNLGTLERHERNQSDSVDPSGLDVYDRRICRAARARRQGKQAAEAREQRLFDRTQNPRAGIHVPIYEATSSAGEAVRLGQPEPGTRQVLLFFNTTCPYCLNSVPTWNALTDLADSRDDVTAIGVALDSTHLVAAYRSDHDLKYPVVELHDPRFVRLFRITTVPLTMVIEPDGRVAYARRGQFASQTFVDSVRAVLDRPVIESPGQPFEVPSVGAVPAAR